MEEEIKRGNGIDSEPFSIIFLGTPDFAVPSLQKLIAVGTTIHLVITQPDRPKGRGKKLSPTPVKTLAAQSNLTIHQPERIKSQSAIEEISSQGAQCAVLVAYGQLLPKEFLDIFPFGVLNVHASLLPRHRGSAPIQRAILSGDTRSGVTIMLLDEGMDTGPVLSQKELDIRADDTSGTLHEKLAQLGAELLVETVWKWKAGLIQPHAQDNSSATYAPPIKKEELRLNWQLSASQLVNTIRAFDPWPGAHAFYHGKRLKLFKARVLEWKFEGHPGEILGTLDEQMVIAGGDGEAFGIGELQLEGQRRLPAREFLRGHPINSGSFME